MFPLNYQQKQPQNADASDLDYERKDLEKTNKKQYNELAQIIQETLGQLITDKENFTIEKLSQKFKELNWEDKQETQKEEILRIWGQTPLPTKTLQEAYHESLKLHHERERKKDLQQNKTHQIRKVQDDETHELKMVKRSQAQGGAAATSETYTATLPKSLISNPAKYSRLIHSLPIDGTSCVQQCGDAWFSLNLTEGGLDQGPLVQPLSSVDHAERDCEIIDDQTGKLALYETLKKSLRELPKLGYSKDHWLRFFQKICRLVDKELFNLYLEETDPTTILTALAQLLDGTSKMEQIEYKIRNFRRLKDHNITTTLHRYEALLQQRIKERSRTTKDKRTAMNPLSLLNTKLWALSKLVVPALGEKIRQKIDRRELAGETVDIEELIKFAQQQEERYEDFKLQETLSLQNKSCEIFVNKTEVETHEERRRRKKYQERRNEERYDRRSRHEENQEDRNRRRRRDEREKQERDEDYQTRRDEERYDRRSRHEDPESDQYRRESTNRIRDNDERRHRTRILSKEEIEDRGGCIKCGNYKEIPCKCRYKKATDKICPSCQTGYHLAHLCGTKE